MSKLTETLKAYDEARAHVLGLQAEIQSKEQQVHACGVRLTALRAEIDVSIGKLRHAQSHLKHVGERVGPLVHADISGICNSRVPDETAAPEPEAPTAPATEPQAAAGGV